MLSLYLHLLYHYICFRVKSNIFSDTSKLRNLQKIIRLIFFLPLQWILHDWNDEECIKILENCKEAIQSDNGKLIIVEAVVGEEKGDKLEFVRLTLDMVMMSHYNAGKERTSKEWEYVLKEAGFSSYTIKPIRAVQSVIIASP